LSYSLEKAESSLSTSNLNIDIRSAEANDIKKLAEVLTLSFHPPQKWTAWVHPLLKLGIYEDLRTRLRNSSPHYRCLVACQSASNPRQEQGDILGTVELSVRCTRPFTPHTPYIANLAVNPNYRRLGVARSLLSKCEQIAFEWGFEEIFLHVLEDNLGAKQLYLKNGYHLYNIDFTLSNMLWGSPKRFLLKKKIGQTGRTG
jgi:ribosomal protein S18 acetylase RimI-like enzyme